MARISKKKGDPIHTRSCTLCNELDTPEMVQCDKCDKFFHFSCVNVDSSISERDWMCQDCATKLAKEPVGQTPTAFLKNPKLVLSPKKSTTVVTPPSSSKSAQPKPSGIKASELDPIPETSAHARTMKELKETVELLSASTKAAADLKKRFDDQKEESESLKLQLGKQASSIEAAVKASENNMKQLATENNQLKLSLEKEKQHQIEMQKQIDELHKLMAEITRARQTTSTPQEHQDDVVEIRTAMVQASQVIPANQADQNDVVENDSLDISRQRAANDARNLLLEIAESSQETGAELNAKSAEFLYETVEKMVKRLMPDNLSRSSSAPVRPTGNSSQESIFDAAFDSELDKQQAETSVDRLTTTMRRQYLQKLPTFNGNIKEWAAFEHVYKQTSIEGKFTAADNVARLREALKPPASQLVLSLILYSSDAERIMEELRDAYGKPEDLIAASLEEIFALPDLHSQVDPGLRTLMILVRNFVATIDSLGAQTEIAGVYTLRKVVPKLHHNHQTEWHAIKIAKPEANLRDFADFLVKKVKQIPTGILTAKTKNGTSTLKPQRSDTQPKRVLSHQAANPSSRAETCFRCGENHKLFSCPDFLKLSTNERWNFVIQKRICSACLRSTSHRQRDCATKRVCGLSSCDRFHNRTLHNKKIQGDSRSSDTSSNQLRNTKIGASENPIGNSESSSSNSSSQSIPTANASVGLHAQGIITSQATELTTSAVMHHVDAEPTLFKIVPIKISGRFKTIDTFAFLDDGSQLTLLDQSIFDQLHLGGTQQALHLQWSNGIVREENSFKTEVTVSGVKSKQRHTLTNVFTVKNLDLPTQSVDVEALKKRHSHLRGLPIPEIKEGKPMILIGLKHPTFLNGASSYSGEDDEPIACKTRLGWAVYGPSSNREGLIKARGNFKSGVQLTMSQTISYDDDLNQLVKHFFSVENFGVSPPKWNLISEAEKRAKEIMQQTLKFIDGRYEIGLLWKKDNIQLPDSWSMAMNRLRLSEKSLRKKPGLLEWKNEHVRELVSKGYARVATAEDLKPKWDRIWFCPTFVTINANKIPPKPRDVCDVAATVRGESLNSNLLKGPDNMAPLLQALFKFRENFIAVNADVKEMFHQISIKPEDQQCQRFMWRDGDDTRPPTIYIMQRMMFGPTCSPTCAQFVKNFHASKFTDSRPEAAKAIKNTTYVDDYFNSHSTFEESLRVVNDAIHICKTMGFQLVGFQSNNIALLRRLPKESVKPSLVDIDSREDQMGTSKLLGVMWHPSEDFFTYRVQLCELVSKMINTNYCPTKREMLRTLMRIFDPIGLISHYLIRGKIVLQEVWREGTGWDEHISEPLQVMWKEFITQLENIAMIRIPRHYAPVSPSEQKVQLVIFVDASEKAFAGSAYFRFSSNDSVHIAQVMGKAKVAPIKKLTIPQLELQAAVLGTRMASTITKMHDFTIHSSTFLSDSRVVLAWIKSTKFNFKTFVASRVGEILDTTQPNQWYHVGTKDNIADDATKHSDPQMGNSETRWFLGADFLKDPFETWPIDAVTITDQEVTESAPYVSMVHLLHINPLPKLDTIDAIKPRFRTNWSSLVRVTAFMLRMKKISIGQLRKGTSIEPDEFRIAENVIFKKIQHETFGEEIRELETRTFVSKTSRILKLSPYLDDGLIRMSSRSQNASITFASKNPPILPNKHELVDIFIAHHHQKNFHMGDEMTIADVREHSWIVDVRSALQRVKRNCQVCKNSKAKPQFPKMGQLHTARVDFGAKPFTHVGLDAFGPYNLKRGRSTVKRYGLIFTCLTYRAVHLEMLDEMTTNACIIAIRRFLVRRGWSSKFYSDNGTNFRGANNLLHKELKELQNHLESKATDQLGIKWSFIPAYSPWFGGAWERLIQSVKKCIDFVMHDEEPNETVFQNALIEAEFWMNRRPLTHTPIDHEDAKPLTPNSVLYGDEQDNLAMMLGVQTVSDKYSSKVHRRVQHLVDKFHSRWIKEYLPQINRRSKWYETKNPLKIGDVVIITDPLLSKDGWRKGRVVKTHPGTDGEVRAADIMLPDKSIVKNRSTGRLAVLDVELSTPIVITSGSATLRSNENQSAKNEAQDDDQLTPVGSATLHSAEEEPQVISEASDGPGNVA